MDFPYFHGFPRGAGLQSTRGEAIQGEKVILFDLMDSKPEDQPGRAEPDFPFDGIKLDD